MVIVDVFDLGNTQCKEEAFVEKADLLYRMQWADSFQLVKVGK